FSQLQCASKPESINVKFRISSGAKGLPAVGTRNWTAALSSRANGGSNMLPNQQQPAWISASTVESAERERAFFRSVYSWMFGGLLLTAFASMWVATSPAMQRVVLANPIIYVVLCLSE